MTYTKYHSAHKRIHSMTHEEVSTIAHAYLVELLHRRSIRFVCEQTEMSRRTVYRWLDDTLPVTAISKGIAAYFILLCETKPALVDTFDSAPTMTAYFDREDARQ